MFTHASQLPVQEWLEDAHAATATHGYANAGNVETFEIEIWLLNFFDILYIWKIIEMFKLRPLNWINVACPSLFWCLYQCFKLRQIFTC
jgi:hypothetical protein